MSQHSPEPWHVDRGGPVNSPLLVCAEGHVIAEAMDDDPLDSEDFARIVSAVNACRGISDDFLKLVNDGHCQLNVSLKNKPLSILVTDAAMSATAGDCKVQQRPTEPAENV